jgi:hypothetical protein
LKKAGEGRMLEKVEKVEEGWRRPEKVDGWNY